MNQSSLQKIAHPNTQQDVSTSLSISKPKRTFVSVITVISIVGVTLGVTMLVLVLAVMSGFGEGAVVMWQVQFPLAVATVDALQVATHRERKVDVWGCLGFPIDDRPDVLAIDWVLGQSGTGEVNNGWQHID